MPATITPAKIRPAAVAGRFYPGEAGPLRAAVAQYLCEAKRAPETESPRGRLKAIIAPHAGYAYSGPIAGSAFAALRELSGQITRVVLVGPSHFVPFTGLAVSSADAFATPLGLVPVDRAAVEQARTLPFVHEIDQAHGREHGLEVHLPFLQETLGDFSVVPLVLGDCTGEQVAQFIELLWGGPETLISISSDLSHYHDYATAQGMDALTAWAIESLSPNDIGHDQACGRRAIQGMLLTARKHRLHVKTLDLRTSGDTAGSRDQVVGYGAWAFRE